MLRLVKLPLVGAKDGNFSSPCQLGLNTLFLNCSKEKKRTKHKHKQKERNSGNETLLSAVKMKPGKVRSFRTGYHSSSGPTDFLKKTYKSPILEV